ncbi:MAG: hypothetical protein AAB698_00715 [Patescibacteria group bacterium]
MDIVQKMVEFLNYAAAWFDRYIISGLAGILTAIAELIIKILEFFIDIIRWLIAYL